MFISFEKLTKESHGEIWIHCSDFSIGIPNPRICFQGVILEPNFIKEIIYLMRHRIYRETCESLISFFQVWLYIKFLFWRGRGYRKEHYSSIWKIVSGLCLLCRITLSKDTCTKCGLDTIRVIQIKQFE